MNNRCLAMLLAATAACASPAFAQEKGAFELSAFGRYTFFSPDWPVLDDGIGVGAGIGLFVTNRLKLSVDASVSSGHIPLHARIVYELPVSDGVRLQLGTGYVHNWYTDDDVPNDQLPDFDDGIGSMAGLKFRLSNAASLFAQVTHDWMPPWLNPKDFIVRGSFSEPIRITQGSDLHWGLEAGVAFRLGGAREDAVVAVVPPPPVRMTPPPQATDTTPSEPTRETATPIAPRYVTLVPVFFDFDQADLRTDTRAALQQAVDILKANAAAEIAIVGNTDERGTDAYNIRLGRRRAEAVRAFLVANGIAASRLEVVSAGERQPLVAGSDESAWAQNRRVEFSVKGGAQLRVP